MDIMNIIAKQLSDPRVYQQLSTNAGTKPQQAQQVTQTALPMLLKALQQNASSPEGAQSLQNALQQHQNDPVSDLLGFFKNVDTSDGSKILQHIFAGQQENVQTDLANKVGLQNNQVSNLLVQLAPLVLGMLGNQQQAQGNQGTVNDLLSQVMGMIGNQPQQQSNQFGIMGLILGFLKKFLAK
ncbi:MAG: DUF937 domain-containing protein [Firmicutes bacterium]|nr:DUF937 domain-containing protein [Bacillota bacterium]